MAEWLDLRRNVDFSVPGDVLGPVNDAIDGVNTALKVLQTQLEVALQLLQVARAFLPGFLDPITQIINLLIDTLIAIFRDLESVGLYLAGDWNLITPDMANLQGGYREYERRMVTRLTDPNDPTRPQVPSTVEVWAAFIYLSVDFSEIYVLTQLLQKITRLFQLPSYQSENLGQPTNLAVKYGATGIPDFIQDYAEATVNAAIAPRDELGQVIPQLDVATVSWDMPKQPSRSGLSVPKNPPSGFLVSVSVFPDGIKVMYDRPVPNAPKDDEGRQPREAGAVRIGGPQGEGLILYGGADQLDVGEGLVYANTMEDEGKVKDGAARVYGTTGKNDGTPIPLDLLGDGDTRYLQKIFYVELGELLGIDSDDWFSAKANFLIELTNYLLTYRYSYQMQASDMPLNVAFEEEGDGSLSRDLEVDDATTFYVRVAPVTSQIRAADNFRYVLREENAYNPGTPMVATLSKVEIEGKQEDVDLKSMGPWSDPVTVSFPLSGVQQYLVTVATALAVVVLSRSDLEVSTEDVFVEGKARKRTGLERLGNIVPTVVRGAPDEFFAGSDQDNQKDDIGPFRSTLYRNLMDEARRIYENSGLNISLLSTTISLGEDLIAWKWSDTSAVAFAPNTAKTIDTNTYTFIDRTILQSLQDGNTDLGVVRNPMMSGIYTFGAGPAGVGATPGFYQNSQGLSSVRNAPGLIVQENEGNRRTVVYLRNLIPEEIYQAAADVLSLTYPPPRMRATGGRWISIRLSELFPELFTVVDTVVSWLEALKRGTRSSVDQIIAYINFLEARILELMGLIKRIDALRALSVTFELPGFEILFVTAQGTEGLLEEFIQAEDKPDDAQAIAETDSGPKNIVPDGAASQEGIETIQAVQESDTPAADVGRGLLVGNLNVGDLLDLGLEEADALVAQGTNLTVGVAVNALNEVIPITNTPYKIDEGAGLLADASTGVQETEEGSERIDVSRFIYSGGAVVVAPNLPPLVLSLFELLLGAAARTVATEAGLAPVEFVEESE